LMQTKTIGVITDCSYFENHFSTVERRNLTSNRQVQHGMFQKFSLKKEKPSPTDIQPLEAKCFLNRGF